MIIKQYVDADYIDSGYIADYETTVIDQVIINEKRIYLKDGVTVFHPVDDIYKEVRFIRRVDESIRVVKNPIEAQGNAPKGGGAYTPRRAVLNNGWVIIPQNNSHYLKITGEMISDDGKSGSELVDISVLDDGVSVLANYEPPTSELIQIETGSGLSPLEQQLLQEIHNSQYRRRVYDSGANTITIYLDDDVTPDKVFDTNSDLSDITPR